MNKKGQAESVIIFFVLMIVVFIVSIIILRVTNEFMSPFSTQLSTINNQSSQAVTHVQNSFTSVWDWVIVLVFFFNVILLLVSAFLVDVHPAFVIIYIIAVIFLFIFGNNFLYVLDSVWNMVGRDSVETTQTLMQQFIINNFQLIMLGIVVLSGIVMYAKIKWFGGSGTGGSY